MDFVKLNGTPVRVTSVFQRTVEQPDGPPLRELELVVIVRGTMAHRSLLALLAKEPIRVDIPSSTHWITLEATVAAAHHTSSGTGEAAAHRHDVTLRETQESADRHAAEQAAQAAEAVPEPEPELEPEPEPAAVAEAVDAAADLSEVRVAGDATVWATALRQLQTPPGARHAPAEPPLTPTELAGVEAVLVGLRLEALIEQLTATGLVRRSAVESNFRRLIQERFVAEATPVVGEHAAKRAMRELLES
jgi:hypothetical protein